MIYRCLFEIKKNLYFALAVSIIEVAIIERVCSPWFL